MFWPLLPVGSLGDDTAIKLAGLLPLAAILYGAVRAGLREHRIPNLLALIGMVAGLLLHTVLPDENGFLDSPPGGVGPWRSLCGLAAGAAAMLPFYRLGGIGAGLVKLMAAIGAILGPADILPAVVGTLLAGGGLALAVTFRHGRGGRLLGNLAAMARHAFVAVARPGFSGAGRIDSAAEAPYVIAVAVGTLSGVLWGLSGARF